MNVDLVYVIPIILFSFLSVLAVFFIMFIQIPKIYKLTFKSIFLILCIGYITWILSNLIFKISNNYTVLYLSNAFANLGILLFIYALYAITKVIGVEENFTQVFKKDLYLMSGAIAVPILGFLSFFTNLIDFEINILANGNKFIVPNFGKYILYLIVILGAILSMYQIVSKLRKISNNLIFFRLMALLISILIAACLGIFFSLLLPILFNDYNWVLLGPISTLIVVFTISLMLVDHRYYDIKNFLFQTVLSFIVGILISIPIGLLISLFGSNNIFYSYVGMIIFFWSFCTMLILRLSRFDIFLSNLLNLNDVESTVKSYLIVQNEVNSIKDLIENFINYITKSLKVKKVYILFRQYKEYDFLNKVDKDRLHLDVLFDQYTQQEQYVFFEEDIKKYYGISNNPFKFKILKQLYTEYDVWVVQKIYYMQNTLGYLLLGGKEESKGFYNNQDLSIISFISKAFAVRFKELCIFDQTKNLNKILKQKVKKATFNLKKQNQIIKLKYQQEKDMIGIMGHELRTPMTIAKASVELLLQKLKMAGSLDNAYSEDKLNKIYKSILKESDLIQTLLSTSHIDNSKVNLQPEEIDLLELINDGIEAYKNDLENKNLYLKIENNLSNNIVFNDPQRLQEIINNLISNAVKYTLKGGITLNLREDNKFIYFSVIDTGVGIPKDEIPKIGLRFHRVHQHLDAKGNVVRAGGTGLGMYVVKGLLQVMGGELKIESEVGKGSIFTVKMPRKIKIDNLHNYLESLDDKNKIPANFVIG